MLLDFDVQLEENLSSEEGFQCLTRLRSNLFQFLPGLADHGNVLILEGLSMEGTEAAGEFVLNPKWFGGFLQKIGQKNTNRIKPFEVLLKLRAVAGGFADPEVVASRYPAQ